MGITELFAFFKALPMMVEELKALRLEVSQLRQDRIDKELEHIKSDVATTLKQIEGAQTNEDRKKLAMELALRMSK